MPLTTLGVVSAVTPSVVETYFSHFLNRGPLRQKPTAHISYHEGLRLIRQFLDYSSKHTIEDLQAFTAQWVPAPHWVRIQDVDITPQYLERSAKLLRDQLGPKGIEQVGGKSWWQWRRPGSPLRAEWIDMKKDVSEWRRAGVECERAILYVHGGAYYFGSVDEHRYQMQRHARKLKARVLAPRYRLAPQFPFPCGLQDCIAAYLFLLEHFDPTQILVAGDSAGGGMVLSMLVILRDRGLPLPAGTILLSPWVDLTHSFPSVAGDGAGDYIPPHGFHHKPSMVWPPPDSDELRSMAAGGKGKKKEDVVATGVQETSGPENKLPAQDRDLSITVDGQTIEIKGQIQMYATNNLLAHPLVSPVQQPSLGGLPPMLIQVGGAELLRDEQLYIAHKAANPTQYPPSDAIIAEYGLNKDDVSKYPPTNVQVQLWEDLCHVPHTLSFTRPAKYMYRAVAQFGAWALAHAQHKTMDIMDDDAISIISSGPETDNEASASTTSLPRTVKKQAPTDDDPIRKARSEGIPLGAIGKSGDPLPPFRDHMIRQRVTRHGIVYPLALPSELACLHLDPTSIGAIKPGPVRKWLREKKASDSRFSSEKRKVQKKRLKEMSQGYSALGQDEHPPPTALAGRRTKDMPVDKPLKKSWGLAMWSGWGSSHDEQTIDREEKLERVPTNQSNQASVAEPVNQTATNPAPRAADTLSPEAVTKERRKSSVSMFSAPWQRKDTTDRPRSPYRHIADTGQAGSTLATGDGALPGVSETGRFPSPAASAMVSRPVSEAMSQDNSSLKQNSTSQIPTTAEVAPGSQKIEGSENTFTSPGNNRPHNGVVAYPFKIRNPIFNNPSTTTLDTLSGEAGPSTSSNGVAPERPSRATSIAPSEVADSEKEIMMPYYEKEAVFTPAANYHPERRYEPSSPADSNGGLPFPIRSVASDPRLNRTDSQGMSAASTATLPASPSESYRQGLSQSRNPAFNPDRQQAVLDKFGGHYHDNSSPTDRNQPMHPKPVGFTYSPRDLRNAMLNRQASESASAVAAASASASSTPTSSQRHFAQPFGAPVELAAPVPTSNSARPSFNSSHRSLADEPVELSASRRSLKPDEPLTALPPLSSPPPALPSMPAPLRNSPPRSTPSGSREISVEENIIMPLVDVRRPVATPSPSSSPPPPPPPPKDVVAPQLRGDGETKAGVARQKSPIFDRPASESSVVGEKPPVIGNIAGLDGEGIS